MHLFVVSLYKLTNYPSLTLLFVSVCALWPPNHNMEYDVLEATFDSQTNINDRAVAIVVLVLAHPPQSWRLFPYLSKPLLRMPHHIVQFLRCVYATWDYQTLHKNYTFPLFFLFLLTKRASMMME